MPRPFKNRCINARPISVVYKPAGIPASQLEWVTLHLDEFEALRLLDHLGLDQEQAANRMGVSRPTVTRIYASARKKIADAIVLGQAISIEGGPVARIPAHPCCGRGRHRHGNRSGE
jgi:predicted DNA-binding protein (UPF0251 family)